MIFRWSHITLTLVILWSFQFFHFVFSSWAPGHLYTATPIFQMRALKLREAKGFVQGHSASKRQGGTIHPRLPTPNPRFLILQHRTNVTCTSLPLGTHGAGRVITAAATTVNANTFTALGLSQDLVSVPYTNELSPYNNPIYDPPCTDAETETWKNA